MKKAPTLLLAITLLSTITCFGADTEVKASAPDAALSFVTEIARRPRWEDFFCQDMIAAIPNESIDQTFIEQVACLKGETLGHLTLGNLFRIALATGGNEWLTQTRANIFLQNGILPAPIAVPGQDQSRYDGRPIEEIMVMLKVWQDEAAADSRIDIIKIMDQSPVYKAKTSKLRKGIDRAFAEAAKAHADGHCNSTPASAPAQYAMHDAPTTFSRLTVDPEPLAPLVVVPTAPSPPSTPREAFHDAPQLDDPNATYKKGLAYWNGDGVDKNRVKAVRLWLSIKDRVNSSHNTQLKADLFYCLGRAYYWGTGTRASNLQAREFLTIAKQAGSSNASRLLAILPKQTTHHMGEEKPSIDTRSFGGGGGGGGHGKNDRAPEQATMNPLRVASGGEARIPTTNPLRADERLIKEYFKKNSSEAFTPKIREIIDSTVHNYHQIDSLVTILQNNACDETLDEISRQASMLGWFRWKKNKTQAVSWWYFSVRIDPYNDHRITMDYLTKAAIGNPLWDSDAAFFLSCCDFCGCCCGKLACCCGNKSAQKAIQSLAANGIMQ